MLSFLAVAIFSFKVHAAIFLVMDSSLAHIGLVLIPYC